MNRLVFSITLASFVVGSNRAVGYSYYDNVTAQQLGKTFPYIVTSGVLKDVEARDLQVGAVTSQIEASVMENTNLFTSKTGQSAFPSPSSVLVRMSCIASLKESGTLGLQIVMVCSFTLLRFLIFASGRFPRNAAFVSFFTSSAWRIVFLVLT